MFWHHKSIGDASGFADKALDVLKKKKAEKILCPRGN
jgi:hypothetical protein